MDEQTTIKSRMVAELYLKRAVKALQNEGYDSDDIRARVEAILGGASTAPNKGDVGNV